MNTKHPSDSKTTVTDLVLPSETNAIHTLFGGELLARMDRAASITPATRTHCCYRSVNHVALIMPSHLEVLLLLKLKSQEHLSSMEVYLDVWYTDNNFNTPIKANEAIFTFVAVDENGKPVQIPELIPESEQEKDALTGR